MNEKTVFLTYNEWIDDIHKGINIDHEDLSIEEITEAIKIYKMIKNTANNN